MQVISHTITFHKDWRIRGIRCQCSQTYKKISQLNYLHYNCKGHTYPGNWTRTGTSLKYISKFKLQATEIVVLVKHQTIKEGSISIIADYILSWLYMGGWGYRLLYQTIEFVLLFLSIVTYQKQNYQLLVWQNYIWITL